MIRHFTRPFATLVVAILSLSIAGVALAHGESVTVQPTTAKPGDTVTVKGEDLGSSRSVEIKLTGTGVDVMLGSAQTDDAGAFAGKYTLPADLRAGQYMIGTKGEDGDDVTADLAVTAAAAATTTGDGQMATTATSVAFQPRERPFEQILALVVVFGVLSGLGLFLARFGGGAREPREERTALLPEGERA